MAQKSRCLEGQRATAPEREGALLDFLGLQLFGAGALGEIVHAAREAQEILLLGVFDFTVNLTLSTKSEGSGKAWLIDCVYGAD